MALLTVGKGGNDKVVEWSESWEGGKYTGLCEELDDAAAAFLDGVQEREAVVVRTEREGLSR